HGAVGLAQCRAALARVAQGRHLSGAGRLGCAVAAAAGGGWPDVGGDLRAGGADGCLVCRPGLAARAVAAGRGTLRRPGLRRGAAGAGAQASSPAALIPIISPSLSEGPAWS